MNQIATSLMLYSRMVHRSLTIIRANIISLQKQFQTLKFVAILCLFFSVSSNHLCCCYTANIGIQLFRLSQQRHINSRLQKYTRQICYSVANPDEATSREQIQTKNDQSVETDIISDTTVTLINDVSQRWLLDGLKLLESLPNPRSQKLAGTGQNRRPSENTSPSENQHSDKSSRQRSDGHNTNNVDSAKSIFYCPSVSNFDTKGTGSLPVGSYVSIDTLDDAKEICKIQVALNVDNCRQYLEYQQDTQSDYERSVSSSVHNFIDSGFTSFQLEQRREALKPMSPITSKLTKDTIHHPTFDMNYNDMTDRSWGYKNVYKPWIDVTPLSILDVCRITVPFKMTDFVIPLVVKSESVKYHTDRAPGQRRQNQIRVIPSRVEIRSIVMEAIQLTGLRFIDDLQLHYNFLDISPDDVSMTMEILDILCDLQRDGYVRVISGYNFPWLLQQQCNRNGYAIRLNQYDSNLLLPTSPEFQKSDTHSNLESLLTNNQKSSATVSDKEIDYVCWSNPLASGWLSGKFGNEIAIISDKQRQQQTQGRKRQNQKPNQYVSSNLFTHDEQYYWDHIVPTWEQRFSAQKQQEKRLTTKINQPISNSGITDRKSLWNLYQNEVMLPLHDISQKYGTSISSIVLRWVLQQENDSKNQKSKLETISTLRPRPFSTAISNSLFDIGSFEQNRKNGYRRIEELRQVFSFHLDDEDIQALNYIHYYPDNTEGEMRDEVEDNAGNGWLSSASFVVNPGNKLFLPNS